MNESDRWEESMLDLFDWIIDFVAGRDDVTADDIRLAIAREFADGPRERDVLLAQYRERADAAVRRLKGFGVAMTDKVAGQDGSALSDALGVLAVRALVKAYSELNEIRARDGVPYTSMGYASSVDADYFSSVVDEIDAAVMALTGKSAHCHPMLYA